MMKRNLLIVTSVIIVCLIGTYFILNKQEKTKVVMTPDEMAAHAKETNDFFKELRTHRKEVRNKPEFQEQVKEYADHRQKIHDAQSKYITFYGKVIDQQGQPVPNAQVLYAATSPHANSSGSGGKLTDKDGMFLIDDARGAVLGIDKIIVPGYEFNIPMFTNFFAYKESSKALLWTDHLNPETAYVFEGWKIENGYPLTSHAKTTYGFELDKTYSMDFRTSNKKEVKHLGKNDVLDLQVLFERNDEADTWSLSLKVPDGGLLGVSDQYMNLAPETGYQQTLTFNGGRRDLSISVNFYIKSRGDYGRLLVEIAPYMRIGSALIIDHVMNLEQGRNLEYKKD